MARGIMRPEKAGRQPIIKMSWLRRKSWMVFEGIPTGYEMRFLVGIGISLAAGFAIGVERESRNKAAGISTHCLVIGGAMIFTFLSSLVDPNSSSRIAAQVISGIGFLGAGLILKSEMNGKVTNLTTAAAVWFAASIGMAIGYEYYFLAIVATAFAVGVPRIPHISKLIKKGDET